MSVIIEETSTFLGMLLNKKRKKKIGNFMMEKFKTFYQFSHDRINITSIWVWFSNKIFKYLKNEKNYLSKVILILECLSSIQIAVSYTNCKLLFQKGDSNLLYHQLTFKATTNFVSLTTHSYFKFNISKSISTLVF